MSAFDQPWAGVPVAVSLVAVVLAYVALFAGAEALHRTLALEVETTRRLVHVVGSLLAIPLPLLLGRPLGIAVAVVAAALQAWSRRRHMLASVHGVARPTYGAIVLPLGIALAAVVAQGYAQYAFGVLVLGFADPAAGLVGRRLGRPIPHWPTAKSFAGSAAFLVVTLILASAFAASGLDVPPRPLAMLASGLVVTVVESVLGMGLDNLAIPAVAAGSYGWLFAG